MLYIVKCLHAGILRQFPRRCLVGHCIISNSLLLTNANNILLVRHFIGDNRKMTVRWSQLKNDCLLVYNSLMTRKMLAQDKC